MLTRDHIVSGTEFFSTRWHADTRHRRFTSAKLLRSGGSSTGSLFSRRTLGISPN